MIFYVGGYGFMFDFLKNEEIVKFCVKVYEGGVVVCVVCYGIVGKLI